MASKTITLYVDDLDGTEIGEGNGGSVAFALDGQEYSIDLTEENAAALRAALQPYIEVAVKVSRKSATKSRRAESGPSPAELRAWATDNGIEIPARGRIPRSVRTAWENK